MTKPTKPCDLYVRVSRVGKRGKAGVPFVTVEEQEHRGRQLATEYGLKVGEVITDLDQSGGKWDRPGLQRALERVRGGLSGGLIVAWLDRLSRDSEHAHRILRELEESGGRVYAPDAPADMQTPEGELQVGLMVLVAQYQRKRFRERWAIQQENAIADGIQVGAGRPAVGYRKREDRRLEQDSRTAPIVRQVFERRAAGTGIVELARMLERADVRTSRGATTWSTEAVRQMLRNRIYLGELSFGRPPRFVNVESHAPIVDLPLFVAAQHPNGVQLQEHRGGGEFVLSGLLRCAGCGYVMEPSRASRKQGGHRCYRCKRTHAGGQCGNPAYVRAERVEQVVLERVRHALTFAYEAIGDQVIPAPGAAADLAAMQQALDVAERRLAAAMRPDMADAAGDGWAAMVAECREARDAAALALGQARIAQGSGVTVTAADRLARWDAGSATDRRRLIAQVAPVLALRRGDPLELIIYPGGGVELPVVPQRGRRADVPMLHPIEPAPGAGVVAL